MRKTVITIVIVAVVVLVALFFILGSNNQQDTGSESSGTTTGNPPANMPIDENEQQGATPTPEATNEVSMDNMAFSPSAIQVKRGTTVTWTNNDIESHTVIGVNGGPASSTIAPGETYSFTFNEVGTFDYICTLHAGMEGQVVVTE